jgi:hypothetical protein
MAREGTEIVANQLAELTRAVDRLTAELEGVRGEPITRKNVRTFSRNASTSPQES